MCLSSYTDIPFVELNKYISPKVESAKYHTGKLFIKDLASNSTLGNVCLLFLAEIEKKQNHIEIIYHL